MLIPFRDLAQRYGMRPQGVLHVGAHHGQEAPEYARIGCNRMIFIEAVPETYEKLKAHVQNYLDASTILACIGDVDGEEVTFNIANNDGQSSSYLEFGTHSIAHPEVKFKGSIPMTTIRLDTLFEDMPINCDMLNLDMQGAELKALKGLGDRLSEFKWLYIEVNKDELYKGCPLVEDIDAYVAQFGFRRAETKWCGNFGWGDALYVRS